MYQQLIESEKWSFTVVIEPDEDGGFVAHCPELRGCWSQGETIDETLHAVSDAIAGWLAARIDYEIDRSATLAFGEGKPSWPMTLTVKGP